MSVPTWAPAKVCRCELLQLVVAVLMTAPPWVEMPTDREEEVVFTSPPTPRAHTPPPGWSGEGLAGADTKALPCWVRKAVLTLPIAEEIEALAALVGTASVSILVMVNGVATCELVHCAKAPGEARTMPAKLTQASKPEPRTDFNKAPITVPNRKKNRNKKVSEKTRSSALDAEAGRGP